MSEEEGEPEELSAEEIEAAAAGFAEAYGPVVTGLLGVDVSLTPTGVSEVAAKEAAGGSDPILSVACRDEGEGVTCMRAVVSRETAAKLGGRQLARTPEEIEAAAAAPLDEEMRGAFKAMVEGALEPLAAAFPDLGIDAAEVQDALEVAEPDQDTSWLDPGGVVRVAFELNCEDERFGFSLLLPGEEGAEGLGPKGLTFLEADPVRCELLDALGEELPCDVDVVEPDVFMREREGDEDGFEPTTLVLPWKLGGRSGLEWLEGMRSDERFAGCRFVMASEEPTRGQVMAALRAGAESFLCIPYEKSEIVKRLLNG